MNDWFNDLQQQLQQAIDSTASELEQQCEEAVEHLDLWLTEQLATIDAAAVDLVSYAEPLIPAEVRQTLDELEVWLQDCDRVFDAAFDELLEVLQTWDEHSNGTEINPEIDTEPDENSSYDPDRTSSDTAPNFSSDTSDLSNDANGFVPLSHVHPTAKQYPACQHCKHYHGYRYGEHLLVCAMHPYGWEDEQCPDWEGEHP